MKKKLDWFLVGAHCLVFAIVLGLGVNVSFVVHSLFGPVFGDMDWVNVGVDILVGVLIALGDFGLFIKTEKAWRLINAYAEENGENPGFRLSALVFLNLIFIGVEIAGILYRAGFLQSKGVGYLVAVGILFALAPPVIGLVIHPMTEPPVGLLEDLEMENFQRQHVQELYSGLKSLPFPERHRAYEEDLSGGLDNAAEDIGEKETQKAEKRRRKTEQRVLTGRRDTTPLPEKKFETLR